MSSKKTRAEMAAIIQKGESVTIDGKLITSISEIPSDAELAKGNVEAEDLAKKNILSKMKELEAELALLKEDKIEVKSEAKSEDSAKVKKAVVADEKK